LEKNNYINEVFDIPVATRKYLVKTNSKIKKISFVIITLFLVIISYSLLRFSKINVYSETATKDLGINQDKSLLGHLPYGEISKEDLVYIEPYIEVHRDMSKSLLKMRNDALNDGIYLVFLSGFRSINLQEEIFYSLKSIRNQIAIERARVSAPPGYSEHSTGFAIDFGDGNNRQTDFEVEFENTDAFRWLKRNAARYHFKLSFSKENKYVDYEPWHWRYEGSIEALKIFEESNRRLINNQIK